MSTVIQRSFSGGELDPALWPRSDLQKYMSGLKTLRNAVVRRNGGALVRPGTSKIAPVKNSSNVARLIPFIYNNSNAYLIELGNQYMRLHLNGVPVTVTALGAWSNSTTYYYGDVVTYGGNFYICVYNGTSRGASSLTYQINPALYGQPLSTHTNKTPGSGTQYWYQLSSNIYEMPTPWSASDLALLKFDRTGNDMVFAHPSYQSYRMTRGLQNYPNSFGMYTIQTGSYLPMACPWSNQVDTNLYTPGGAGVVTYAVVPVAASGDEHAQTGNESISNGMVAFTIASSTITAGAIYSNNGQYFTVLYSITSGTQIFTSATGYPTATGTLTLYSGVGPPTIAFSFSAPIGAGITTTKTVSTSSAPVQLIWQQIPSAISYNIYYRNTNGVFGYLGSTQSFFFFDYGYTPDYSNAWVQDVGQIFGSSNNYPSAVAFYQQRTMYGNTNNYPTKVWGSETGLFDNFNVNVPSVASDALSFKMAGEMDVIEHLLYLGVLIVFTYGTINSVQGDASGALTPSSINPRRESVNGSSSLRPLVVGEFALYNQAQGAIIRDLGYNFQVGGYRGDDLTVFATHLFDNFTIVDWAYQTLPNSIVWAVRSDGTLLSMTYVREQQILAWSHHDTTNGFFENVCCIPEGNQWALYVIANRTINGTTTRFVERLNPQQFTDVRNYTGMDCATTFDGRNTTTDMATLSGGTNWNETELLTLTLNANNFLTFTSADASNNNVIYLYDAAGKLVRFKITGYSSATVVTGFVDRTVPLDLQGVATAIWSYARISLSGLNYLANQNVSVFGDGNVVGSPNNAAYPIYTVSNTGTLLLDQHYAVIQVGLPITSDIETLDIDTPGQADTLSNKKKFIGEVTIHTVNSRSTFIGGENPDTDPANTLADPLYRLTEQKLRRNEGYDNPMALQTGKNTQNIQGQWDYNGHVFIRHVDPTPLLIAAIAPEGLYPLRAG